MQDVTGVPENKMGVRPVKKLIIEMSLPIMLSMFIQSMYNIVDSIFVARISENALTAVSLAFPFQMLIVGVAVGTGIGISSLVARRLGAKLQHEADIAASNGLFLAAVSSVVFFIFGFFSRPAMSIFTNDPEILELGAEYLSINMLYSFGIIFLVCNEKILQATGNNRSTMAASAAGTSGRKAATDGDGPCTMAKTSTWPLGVENGERPVSISQRTHPKDQISVRASVGRPCACSGDM
jgi:Na+-driven multidrug efflux pump